MKKIILLALSISLLISCKPKKEEIILLTTTILESQNAILIAEDSLVVFIKENKVDNDSTLVLGNTDINLNFYEDSLRKDKILLLSANLEQQIINSKAALFNLTELNKDDSLVYKANEFITIYEEIFNTKTKQIVDICCIPSNEYTEQNDTDFVRLSQEIDFNINNAIIDFTNYLELYLTFYLVDPQLIQESLYTK